MAPLRKEAEEFAAWLDGLLARLNRPLPPIDEEMLRERIRQCDETGSWVNSEAVLAELQKGDS